MEKPSAPLAAFPPSPSPSAAAGGAGSIRRRLRKAPPSPDELVAHYESQGVDPKEAPLKVIEDLQSVIIRVIGSGRDSKDKFMANTTRKLDSMPRRPFPSSGNRIGPDVRCCPRCWEEAIIMMNPNPIPPSSTT